MRRVLLLAFFILPYTFSWAYIQRDSVLTDSIPNDSARISVESYLRTASEIAAQEPLQAVENYRNALIHAVGKDDIWQADVRMSMAKLLLKKKKKEGLLQLGTAESIYKKHKDLTQLSEIARLKAQYYEKNSLFPEALKQYTDLYKLQDEAGEAVQAGNTASHLCHLFIKRKNYKEAFNYADLAKNFYYKVCRRDSLGAIYLTIAQIKLMQKQTRLAEFYIVHKALPYYNSADDLNGKMKSFNFLARMYRDQKRYSQAKWFYLQANTQSRDLNDTTATITSLLNLSIVKALNGDLLLARQDLNEATALSQDERYADILKQYKARYRTLFKKIEIKENESASL